MPYMSYEEFDREQIVSELINSTFKEHRELEILTSLTKVDKQSNGDLYMRGNKKSTAQNDSKGEDRSENGEGEDTKDDQVCEMSEQVMGSDDPDLEGMIEYAR
jgi:hypothetical protein